MAVSITGWGHNKFGTNPNISSEEMIKDVVGFKGIIAFDETKPNGNDRKLLDSSLINSFGWRPKIGLNEGLDKTYSWYVNNYDNLRV